MPTSHPRALTPKRAATLGRWQAKQQLVLPSREPSHTKTPLGREGELQNPLCFPPETPHSMPEQIVQAPIEHFHTNTLSNFRAGLKRNVLQEPCQPQKGLATQKDQM